MRLFPKWHGEYTRRQSFLVTVATLSLPDEQQLGEVYRAQLLFSFGAKMGEPLGDIADPIVRVLLTLWQDESPELDRLWQRMWDALEFMSMAEFVEWFVANGLDTTGAQDRDKPFEYRTRFGGRPRALGAERRLERMRQEYGSFTPDERTHRLAAIRDGAIFVDPF